MSDAAAPLLATANGVSYGSLPHLPENRVPRRIPPLVYFNAMVQIFLLVSAQGLRQFYYADSFADELAKNSLISEDASLSLWWLWAFVLPDVLIRTFTVLASRIPSILRDAKHDPSLDRLVTQNIVGQLLAKIDLDGMAERPQNAEYDEKAGREARAITGIKITPDRSCDFIAAHPYAHGTARVLGYTDAFYAIPSTIFFAITCYSNFKSGEKTFLESLLVVVVGAVIGAYGAKSYLSYRMDRSVYRNSVILPEIWKHRANPDLKIKWPEFKSALRWSSYIAVTQGVFTYFSGAHMMQEFITWICQQTQADDSQWQGVGTAVALIGGLVCAHTNFHNKMTTALVRFVQNEASPVEEMEEAGKKGLVVEVAPTPLEPNYRRDIAVAATKCMGGLSTALDYPLTIMTFLFIWRFIYDPDANKAVLWTTLAITAAFLWPINRFTYDYTIGEAAKGVYKKFTPAPSAARG